MKIPLMSEKQSGMRGIIMGSQQKKVVSQHTALICTAG